MKLILVGAGPGDPDLLTLKAVKVLQKARVVLYDALVHPSILDHCPPTCLLLSVGKRGGKLSCKQDEIHQLIYRYAQQEKEVVRLKGGDPFVFGRGYEEIEFASKLGIACEIVPGVSSTYAAPALAGIPVTLRGHSESFWVVTGTTKEHLLSEDIALAARSTATVVILMGMQKLPEIVETYLNLGRGEEFIAIVQNGSLPNQRSVSGTIHTILKVAQDADIGSPAVIVIGPVAALHDQASLIAAPYSTTSTEVI
jgi:uroporphyrin-III C-methyltransferase